MNKLESIIAILEDAKADYAKLYDENKKSAAQTLRGKLQNAILACKDLRVDSNELRKTLSVKKPK